MVMRGARAALTAGAGYLATVGAYHLGLTVAAALHPARRRAPDADPPARMRFLVLVPAHDEEPVIGATLAAIGRLETAGAAPHVVVVADHCTDRTAEIASAAGATVLRREGGARGKGHALSWALTQPDAGLADVDVVVFVDADCEPTPNLLSAVEWRLATGAEAVQVDDVVANPEEGPAAAIRYAAFRLINSVKPLGKDALGWSVGLMGTGMAFRREVLERHGWKAFGLIEDAEQHLSLVETGVRVRFAPEAAVSSAMPTTFGESAEQQARWESSHLAVLREWAPRLVASAVRSRRPARAAPVLDLLVPPQSLLFAANGMVFATAVLAGTPRARRLATVAVAAQATYVVGGLALVGAPPAAWRGLLHAPVLVVQKLGIVARLARGRGPRDWVRTARS